MPRTLLYDPGMVGLPSVLVRTPVAPARKASRRARARPAGAHAQGPYARAQGPQARTRKARRRAWRCVPTRLGR